MSISRFISANYNTIDIAYPSRGINQAFPKDKIGTNFAWELENLLPNISGYGELRNGTEIVASLDSVNDKKYMESIASVFEASDVNNSKIILWTNYFESINAIIGVDKYRVIDERTITFYFLEDAPVDIKKRFIPGALVLVEISYGGLREIEVELVNVDIDHLSFTLTFIDPILNGFASRDFIVTKLYIEKSGIRSCSVEDFSISSLLMTDLFAASIPRSTTFMNDLYIFNGIDPVMQYSLRNDFVYTVRDRFRQNFTNIVVRGNTLELIVGDNIFDINNFKIGNSIIIRDGTGEKTYDIVVDAYLNAYGKVIFVVDSEVVNKGSISLYVLKRIPSFSYMVPINDRLMALGPGSTNGDPRELQERMVVYFQHETFSNSGGWFKDSNQKISYIDLSSKFNISDNLEAIVQYGAHTVFMGRNKTVVYSGYDMDIPTSTNLFRFEKTIDIGIIHGSLIVNVPNDVLFVSQGGIHSLSRAYVSGEIKTLEYGNVNEIVRASIKEMFRSRSMYESAKAFVYNYGPFCGFFIGGSTLVSSISSKHDSVWSRFSGSFSKCSDFVQVDNTLYLSEGSELLKYTNGMDWKKATWTDKGQPIFFRWDSGIFQNGRRFKCLRGKIIADYSSNIAYDSRTNIVLRFNLVDPSSNQVLKEIQLDREVSDVEGTVPYNIDGIYGHRYMNYSEKQKTFKIIFSSSSFWFSFFGCVYDGPLILKGIKLYGVNEEIR